jgi:hypothetical protein
MAEAAPHEEHHQNEFLTCKSCCHGLHVTVLFNNTVIHVTRLIIELHKLVPFFVDTKGNMHDLPNYLVQPFTCT